MTGELKESCGHGTFAFTECVVGTVNGDLNVAHWGCKARTTGKPIRTKNFYMRCSQICQDNGTSVNCDGR